MSALKIVMLVGPRCKSDYDLIKEAGSSACMAMVRRIRDEHRNNKKCACWTCRAHPDL